MCLNEDPTIGYIAVWWDTWTTILSATKIQKSLVERICVLLLDQETQGLLIRRRLTFACAPSCREDEEVRIVCWTIDGSRELRRYIRIELQT